MHLWNRIAACADEHELSDGVVDTNEIVNGTMKGVTVEVNSLTAPKVAEGTLMWFFFFQAEDGIRDYKVTGVQTCALPIWNEVLRRLDAFDDSKRHPQVEISPKYQTRYSVCSGRSWRNFGCYYQRPDSKEIGRASCRERV